MKIAYDGEQMILQFKKYNTNKRVALQIFDPIGIPYSRVTVNLVDADIAEDEVAIDANNDPSALSQLMDAGIISSPLRYATSGFCSYPICKLLKTE